MAHRTPPLTSLRSALAVLVLLVAGAGIYALPAAGQTTMERSLHIQDGTVYIDGEEVSSDALPQGLRIEGIHLRYHVRGIEEPIVQIQGRTYRLTATGLEPLEAPRPDSDHDDPSTEYLDLLRAQSQALYEDVRREYALEHTAQQRAYRIRQMEAGPERTAHLDTLRQTVSQLFDIKQANRQREIEHLEQQVELMRQRMHERSAHRETMINQRIRQLLGNADL